LVVPRKRQSGPQNTSCIGYKLGFAGLTGTDTLRVLTTVGFPALQFNAEKKQFVAFSNVPKAVVELSNCDHE
jgi:hypothetical protein